jgi:hypothetical protein
VKGINMNDQNKSIEQYRNLYVNYSDTQLIAEMQKFVTHAAQHIAAKQLLAERETKKTTISIKTI